MKEYLMYVALTWVAKKSADYFVKKSKLTAKKTDDIVAEWYKKVVNFGSEIVRKK
jgi:hypothetical protein